eukprot:scaffold211951_cov22-Tisochrysis_lutea.AAC.1
MQEPITHVFSLGLSKRWVYVKQENLNPSSFACKIQKKSGWRSAHKGYKGWNLAHACSYAEIEGEQAQCA